MPSDLRTEMTQNSAKLVRSIVRFLCLAVYVAAISCTAASATRLPPDLKSAILTRFPDARIRLDGAIETKKGDLYLPLVPIKPPTAKAFLMERYPVAGESVDILTYGDGWCFLRVIKTKFGRTIGFPANLTEGLRNSIFAARFPGDLIVPENFSIPRPLKPIIGDHDIPINETARPNVVALHPKSTPAPPPAPKITRPLPKIGLLVGQIPLPLKPEKFADAPLSNHYIFVTSPSTGTISMLDGESLQKVMEFPTEGTPESMAFATGKLYIADQAKNRILILDPRKKQFLGQIDLPAKSAPKGLAALPNGKLLYASESAAGNVDVIETETGKVLLKTKVAAGPGRIAISPNGNLLGVLNVPAGQLTLISTANQKVVGVVTVGSMPNALVFNHDSTNVFVSNRISNTVSVVDVTTKRVVLTLKTGLGPTGMVLSKDGKLFVANAKDNLLQVFDPVKKEKLREVKLPMDVDFPGSLIMTPDGKHIIVSSASTDAVGIFSVEKLEFESQPVIGHTSDELIWLQLD